MQIWILKKLQSVFYILKNKFLIYFILGDNRPHFTPSLRKIHCKQETSPSKLQAWSQQNLSGWEVCLCDVKSYCHLYEEESQLSHHAFTGGTQQGISITGVAKEKPLPRNSQPQVSAPTLNLKNMKAEIKLKL